MAFAGPNSQFKMTASKFRRVLRALGFDYVQVYNRLRAFKLRKHIHVFTVTALSTATTAGSQYTTPNGNVFMLQESAASGATKMRMLGDQSPDAASSTLTYVTGSSGSLGTHQASIAYSAVNSSLPADLGPVQTQE